MQTDVETLVPAVNTLLLEKLIADGFVKTYYSGKIDDVIKSPHSNAR